CYPCAISKTYVLRPTRTPVCISVSKKYTRIKSKLVPHPPPSRSGMAASSTVRMTKMDATAAPTLMSCLLERSANLPKMRPPSSDAMPEAMTNPPSPAKLWASYCIDKVTISGGLREDTSNRLRTVTRCQNFRSSRNKRYRPLKLFEEVALRCSGVVSGSDAGSRIPEYHSATPTQKVAPSASNQASCTCDKLSPPKKRMARPKVIATNPDAVVANPLI